MPYICVRVCVYKYPHRIVRKQITKWKNVSQRFKTERNEISPPPFLDCESLLCSVFSSLMYARVSLVLFCLRVIWERKRALLSKIDTRFEIWLSLSGSSGLRCAALCCVRVCVCVCVCARLQVRLWETLKLEREAKRREDEAFSMAKRRRRCPRSHLGGH